MKIPRVESSKLVMVDIQERLAPAMSGMDGVLNRSALLLRGASELKLETIVTEQYPKGLGSTLPELAELLPAGTPVVAKTGFSVFQEPEFRKLLIDRPVETLIFFGIEAHVCVLQSMFDALEAGFQVVLAVDATTSRKESSCDAALKAARHAGVMAVDSESILFQLLRDASYPSFKAVSKLVR